MKQILLKSPEEIDMLREAGRVSAAVLRAIGDAVHPGVTTRELDDFALATLRSMGVESAFYQYCGYPAQCCISVNETVIHGIPGSRVLREGEAAVPEIKKQVEAMMANYPLYA